MSDKFVQSETHSKSFETFDDAYVFFKDTVNDFMSVGYQIARAEINRDNFYSQDYDEPCVTAYNVTVCGNLYKNI